MADSITLTLYIFVGVIALVVVVSAFRGAQSFFKLRRPFVKSPKFRSKSILFDETDFGAAVVDGFEADSPNSGFVMLTSQNGIKFKQHYSNYEIEPIHPLETMGGSERPAWRVKGKPYKDTSKDKVDSEKETIELANRLKTKGIQEKIAVNEAATLKDMAMDIFKEVKEQQKTEQVKLVK